MNSNLDAPNNGDYTDLHQLVLTVWKKRWWVLTSIILFTGMFTLVAFTMRPVYSASAVVIPASSERSSSGALTSALGQLGGLASLAGVSLGGTSDAETTEALAILRSRAFIEKFITEENLMPEIYSKYWDSRSKTWVMPEGTKAPTVSKTYKAFIESVLSVSQDKKTSLITVKITWHDRNKAALWANDLIARINETMRRRSIQNSEASIGYLEKEMKSTTVVAAQEAVNRLIEIQIKQRMLANVTPEYAFRVVDGAMPPDADQPIRPRKRLLMASGFALGGMIGVIGVVLASRQSMSRNRSDLTN